MIIKNIFRDVAQIDNQLIYESGIQLPKNTKAAKIIHHRDMDGVFSAIITYNQLVKQGISPKHIRITGIQYGDDQKDKKGLVKKFKKSKGQAVVLVDFARIPDDLDKPDFWSDHHEYEGKEKPKSAGKIGATEWKSDASHLAILHTNNMVDSSTLKAIDIVDSAGYTKLEDVITMPKNFKEKGRMERLAIICNALLTNSKIVDNDSLMEKFIKTTKPSLVSFYNNILNYNRLSKIQAEAIKELSKKDPDWEKVEKSRKVMPSKEARDKIIRSDKVPFRDKIQEGALDDYEELEELKKKGKDRTKEEEKRYKKLVNKPIDDVKARRDMISKSAKDSKKFKSRGSTIVQTDSKMQRYVWTQLNKKGLKHPFVIKRYPTFMQIAVNPELPSNIKELIDLNKIRRIVMGEIKNKYGNKYNDWAFNIIEKDSGGHKGITNVAALGTLGIMPKKDREKLKYLKKLEKRIKDLKTYGRGKLSPEDKEKLDIANKMVKRKTLPDDEKLYYEKLRTILMPSMERIMPEKASEMKELLKKKEIFGEKRKEIMNDIEDEFVKSFKKFFNASEDIPVMGKRSDVVIPGGKEEYALEQFIEELNK